MICFPRHQLKCDHPSLIAHPLVSAVLRSRRWYRYVNFAVGVYSPPVKAANGEQRQLWSYTDGSSATYASERIFPRDGRCVFVRAFKYAHHSEHVDVDPMLVTPTPSKDE